MSTTYTLFIVLAFVAVFLLLEGLFLLLSQSGSEEDKRLRHRLQAMAVGHASGPASSLIKQRVLSQWAPLHDFLVEFPGAMRLDLLLLQACSQQSLAMLLASCVVGGGLGWTLAWVIQAGTVLGPVLLILGASLPVWRLWWMRQTRLRQLSAQMPDALDLMVRALRAGHAFSAALAMASTESPEPIAAEFKTTFDEINFGLTTKQALTNLAERVPSPDIRYFVMAVIIQLETGGNLASLLSMLSSLIRERYKLLGKIRVLAAEGKLSAVILVALPFVVGGLIQAINPTYLEMLYTDPAGVRLLTITAVMMLLGIAALWRITRFHI